MLLAGALLCFAFAVFVPIDMKHGHLADLTPGVVYEAGPYFAPAGCPHRAWREGEFMPGSCARGQRMRGEQIGLQEDGSMRGSAHTPPAYRWIRSGPDALLVGCPMMASCKIFQVVSGRFTASAKDSPPRAAEDRATLSRPPDSYRVAVKFPMLPIVVLGFAAFIIALMPAAAFRRDTSPSSPASPPSGPGGP